MICELLDEVHVWQDPNRSQYAAEIEECRHQNVHNDTSALEKLVFHNLFHGGQLNVRGSLEKMNTESRLCATAKSTEPVRHHLRLAEEV